MVGPTPIRRLTRFVTSPATIEPSGLATKTIAISIFDSSRVRAMYRMRMAFDSVEKKFDVPVHIAIDRSHGWRATQLRPSLTWGHIFGCFWPGSGFGGASRCRIEIMNSVEATKLAQSARIAIAAPTTAIRPAAIGGPLTEATLAVSCSFELPSIRSSRSISAGRYDWYATS